MRKLSILALGSVFATGAFFTACDDDDGPFDEVEETLDCREACTDWQECVGDEFDVSDCTDRCEDLRDQNVVTEAQVEDCSDCLDAATALECSTACTAECAGLFDEG
jgi:hypothetical protein